MKAVLSNRIFMEASPEYRKILSDELTYKIPSQNPNDPPQIIKNLQRVRENLVSIPIGRTDLIPRDYEIVEKRLEVPVDFPEFQFTLRQSQQDVYDALDDNCIINAWVSWGKTFTGLAIAGKLGQKTLVVTHTVPLRNQWAKEVEKVYGISPGIIGSGRFELDSPIVIGNTQTLYRNIEKIRKEFGTIILDEMHHVSSPTFSKIIDTSHARYKIGLSGTIERKDGKHVVFRDYFSPNIFKPPKENFLTPTIHIYRSEVRFPDGANIPWAKRVNAIANNDFETFAFFMNEYEETLNEENKRNIKFLKEGEDLTRYGDIEHEYYIQTTMKMAEGNSAAAYFYFNRYLDIMKNRFLYNMDWKPIPDYAK